MHELAITQSILDIALTEAAAHGAKKVSKIYLRIGALAGIMPELIQEYYNIISAGTAADGAEISIERVAATLHCLDCGDESLVEAFKLSCPLCGSTHIKLLTGHEYYVDSLEAE